MMKPAIGSICTLLALTPMLLGGMIAPPVARALDADEMVNVSVYEKDAPAVVSISVDTPEGPSSGAGSVIDPSGLILTSSHVLEQATSASVSFDNGEKYAAEVIARVGSNADLAILKIHPRHPLAAIRLGDSAKLKVGQKVLAIGNPYGFDRTLTTGIVSRIDHQKDRIQTDASINPGNSGGPLLNSDGELIGINQSIFNPEGRRTNIGIGFAVPVDAAKDFIREIAGLPTLTHPAEELTAEYKAPNGGENDIPVLLKNFTQHF